jgi:hypothetical protein
VPGSDIELTQNSKFPYEEIRKKILDLRKSWGIPLSLPIRMERVIENLEGISKSRHSGVIDCYKKLFGETLLGHFIPLEG